MKHFLGTVLWTQVLTLALLIMLLYPMDAWRADMLWGVLASIFVLFVPGYWISYVLFGTDELSAFERCAMSAAISIAVISFGSFYLHYFGIALYPIYIVVFTIAICLLAGICIYWLDHRDIHY